MVLRIIAILCYNNYQLCGSFLLCKGSFSFTELPLTRHRRPKRQTLIHDKNNMTMTWTLTYNLLYGGQALNVEAEVTPRKASAYRLLLMKLIMSRTVRDLNLSRYAYGSD